MLNPQGKHGLNNAVLRTLLRFRDIYARENDKDEEDHAHLHITNFVWGVPAKDPGDEDLITGFCESGDAIISSDCHIYIETEKHVIIIYNDFLARHVNNYSATKLFPPYLHHLALKQQKVVDRFYLKDEGLDPVADSIEDTWNYDGILNNQPVQGMAIPDIIKFHEFKSELEKFLSESRHQINIPGVRHDNPYLDLFYMLLDGKTDSNFMTRLASFYSEPDESYKNPPPNPSDWDENQAAIKNSQLQDLCSSAIADLTDKNIRHHCWLWYPLKFSNRLLASGLPFVVYELETEELGKITLDMHYDAAGKYWRLDVFRRPGRQGEDIGEVLSARGIHYIEIDQQENYVPKYVVLKTPATNKTEEESKQVKSSLETILDKLIG